MSPETAWCRMCDERRPVAKGLCLRCYQCRQRGWQPTDGEDGYGQPDGYGYYGLLSEQDGRLVCHECGRRYRSLGVHVANKHDMTADEYRAAHGLARGLGLVAEQVRHQQSEIARARIDTPGWDRFTAARDPVAASQARDSPGYSPAPAARRARAESAARRNAASRRATERVCPACEARWCPLPGGYDKRTCGAAACRSAIAAATARQSQPDRPRLSEQHHARLLTLHGQDLVDYCHELSAQHIRHSDIAAALGISAAGMSRLLHGHIPASLR